MFLRDAYDAARRTAAFIDRTASRGRIVAAGPDRATYLQGLLTNDTVSLVSGQGRYAAMLTPQGRMIADMWLYELGDVMLLTLAREVKDTILAKLDQFIFNENVQLGDVTGTFGQIAVIGPEAGAVIAAMLDALPGDTLSSLTPHGNLRATVQEQPAIVTRIDDAGVSGYDLYVDVSLRDGLIAGLEARGISDATGDTAETLRIEGGMPLFGRDMDSETIPLEAGIESRAISFDKGCYVGQEVIIRVLHRGHGRVAKRLVGITFEASSGVPAPGATVRTDERDIGRVTSATFSPSLDRPIALGYVQRDFVAPGTALRVNGLPGTVVELPFIK